MNTDTQNLERIRQAAGAAGLDAVIAWGGANFQYVTGFQNYFDGPAASIALIPARADLEPVIIVADWVLEAAEAASCIRNIVTYPLWLEIADLADVRANSLERRQKPSPRYNIPDIIARLAELAGERGLATGRIGIELGAISASAFDLLKRNLPDAELKDHSSVFLEVRSIKSDREVRLLEEATRFAEEGLLYLANSDLVGRDAAGLRLLFDNFCMERSQALPDVDFQGTRVTAAIGGNVSPTRAGGPRVTSEDLIFFDCGVSVGGYGSDTGRTLAMQPPSDEARWLMDALRAGMDAALELMRPGTPMCDIFHAGQDAVRRNGLDWYSRGHIGHALGMGTAEQAPYISPVEKRPLLPGMVMAVETPLYVRGLGGFQLEECVLITEDGYRAITTLPRDFLVVKPRS